jgi:hypothetical protein
MGSPIADRDYRTAREWGELAAELGFGNAGVWNGAANPDINIRDAKNELGELEKYILVDAFLKRSRWRLMRELGLEG